MNRQDSSGLERLAEHNKKRRAKPDNGDATPTARPPLILPPPTEPMQVAREFMGRCCLDPEALEALTLRYWHGGWWKPASPPLR